MVMSPENGRVMVTLVNVSAVNSYIFLSVVSVLFALFFPVTRSEGR